MNNYSSSNFATVFFLVVLFIGTGVLIYHTVEVSNENRQLKETIVTLQANAETLSAENANLKTDNSALVMKNNELTNENTGLKTALEQAAAENTSLKTRNAEMATQLENLQAQCTSVGDGNTAPEVLESTFLPTDPQFWMRAAMVVLIVTILLLGYTVYTITKEIRRKRAVVLNGMNHNRALSQKDQSPHLIDSRFLDR